MLFESIVDTVWKAEIVTLITNITRWKGWWKLEKTFSINHIFLTRNWRYLFHVSDIFPATHVGVVLSLGSHGNTL